MFRTISKEQRRKAVLDGYKRGLRAGILLSVITAGILNLIF